MRPSSSSKRVLLWVPIGTRVSWTSVGSPCALQPVEAVLVLSDRAWNDVIGVEVSDPLALELK